MTFLPHHCAKCTGRWNGFNTAHCSACHLTFTGVTAFDKHRAGNHSVRRYCLSPEEVGLVLTGRAYPCWGFPSDDNFWETNADE